MEKKDYKPWSEDADEELRSLVGSGLSINELANHFGRSEGAISSRIKRLGLKATSSKSKQSSPHIGANKQLATNKMETKKRDLYDHPDHGRVRKHFATGLEVSEDGQFIEKRFSDPHTGDTKSFSPKVIEDANGRSYINWSDRKVYIDEIVCTCFHGLPKPKQKVVHIDGNLTNNHADNLRWQ